MTKKTRRSVLIISHDKIGDNMAGPGIRYHHMAEFLAKDFDVTVGFFDPAYLPAKSFGHNYKVVHVDRRDFRDSFSKTDVVIAMWLGEEMMTFCKQRGIFVVFDIYAPVPVENLALLLYSGNKVTANTDYEYRQSYNLYEKFFEYGDLFLLSNRRQLDFWIGYVFGSGLVNVTNYQKRPVFERFIYAPMGVDASSAPTRAKPVIRDKIPAIKEEDKILLWTGGIWNWFDAQTLIRAMARLQKTRPDIKLLFFGTKHPNPDVPAMKEASDALALAKELGVYNKTVFLHEGWVPYTERIDYLFEADAAINTTKDTIESEFSHRTRVLDHILCALPTIATAGDYISDEVITHRQIGITVPPEDEDALVEAITTILDEKTNHKMRSTIRAIQGEYEWESTLKPLRDTLINHTPKLPWVQIKKPRELPKDTTLYKLGKALIPRPVKTTIVKVFRYGR